jgi:outer membrane protein assembly factor BamB/DNA-binding transcriptional ArsR family regulator
MAPEWGLTFRARKMTWMMKTMRDEPRWRQAASCLLWAAAAAMLLSAASGAAQPSDSWPMYRAGPEHSGSSDSSVSSEPSLLWTASVGFSALTSPVAAGGRLFAGSADGSVYALWASTGGEAWRFHMGGKVTAEPAVEGTTVYALSETGRLCALDAENGSLFWESSLPSGPTYSLPLTIADDGLYISTVSGGIIKCSVAERGAILWEADAGAHLKGPVTVGEGLAVAIAEGGKVQAFHASDGTPNWSARQGFGGSDEFTSALVEGRLCFGTRGKDVFCLDPRNGDILWNATVKSTISGSPAVGRGIMVLCTENGIITAINTSTGNASWSFDVGANVTVSPSMADGAVFLGSEKGGIYMLRASSGQLVWYNKAGGARLSSPAISEGRILLTTRDGGAMAFGKPEPPRPVARLDIEPRRVSVGDVVSFSAVNSSGTVSSALSACLFDFGDGQSSGWITGREAIHSYDRKGNFTVSLRVRDASGTESDPAIVHLEVFNYKPEVRIRLPESDAIAGKPVELSADASDSDGRIVQYIWYFGDESQPWNGTQLPQNLTHIFMENGTYTVGLEVFDDNGTAGTGVGELLVLPKPLAPKPGPASAWVAAPVPVIAASASLAVLGAVGACLSFTEFGKYRLLSIFFVPLYVRLKRDEVLDNYVRGQIHGYIIANPGDHYNSIRDALELSNGILAHHLKTLEREGLVQSMRDGMYRRFFPANAKLPPEDEGHFNIQKRIVGIIRLNPGISQKEISLKVGVSGPTVNYHVSVLSTARMIRVEKQGRVTHCYVIEQQPPT